MRPVDLPPLPATPLVSVLVCNYNYAGFIGRCIDSVLAQTYGHFELIVCDNSSTDESCAIVERYAQKDTRIKLLRQPTNAGQPAALTAAYREARGEILCILDSDDYFHPDKLDSVVRCLSSSPNVGYVIHPLLLVDATGKVMQPLTLVDNFEEGFIAESIVRRGGRWRSMTASGVSFRRELSCYVFPVPDGIIPDVLFNTLLPLLTPVAVIRKYLAYYTLHGKNMSSDIRDYSSLDSGISSASAFLRTVERAVQAVNTRIDELGLDVPPIDLGRNLDYRLRAFSLSLLARTTPFGRLLQQYASLVGIFRRDDMYRLPHKIILLAAYGLALGLPRALRPWLIETVHMPNKLKYLLLRRGASKFPVGAV
jgi:glycosyltransferase involved in cell wall biosynthesis